MRVLALVAAIALFASCVQAHSATELHGAKGLRAWGSQVLSAGMQPEVVSKLLAKIESEWTTKAVSTLRGERDNATTLAEVQQSCSKIASSIVQGSSGNKDNVIEYMSDVCATNAAQSGEETGCKAFSSALQQLMSYDESTNRNDLDYPNFCASYYKATVMVNAKAEKAREDQAAAEKRAAEEKAAKEAAEKKAAEEKAAKEAAEKKTAEEKAAKEAAEKKTAEQKAAKEAAKKAAEKKAAEEKAAKEAAEKKAAEDKAEQEVREAEEKARKAAEVAAEKRKAIAQRKTIASAPAKEPVAKEQVAAAPAKTETEKKQLTLASVHSPKARVHQMQQKLGASALVKQTKQSKTKTSMS